MYKYILLDLDNTLLDFNAGELDAFNKVLESEDIAFTDDIMNQYKEMNTGLWTDLELGKISRKTLLDTRFQLFFDSLSHQVDGVEKEKIFRETLNNSHELVEGAMDLLEYLKAKDVVICSASNGVYHTQMQRMHLSDIYQYFDHHFISEKIGYEKPDKRFFEHCLDVLNIKDKSEVLMIGDTPTSDILGAQNIGIDSCYFGEKTTNATFNVKKLYEIKHIIN